MAYWLLKYILLGPMLAILGRPKVEGLEYVPQSGPVILASNHLAVMDSFYLPLVVRRRITFLAKSEYFTGTGLKGWLSRWFFTAVGQHGLHHVPVDLRLAHARPRTVAARLQHLVAERRGFFEQGNLLIAFERAHHFQEVAEFCKANIGQARL